MHDGPKIIAWIVVFVAVVTLPIWFTTAAGNPGYVPEVTIPASAGTECVLPAEEMRGAHMELLNEWRNEVVRHGKRVYVSHNGTEHYMSLSNTCLACHNNRAEFCDRCHDYAGVSPDCWGCHIDPTRE